jgi:hypothetical protein
MTSAKMVKQKELLKVFRINNEGNLERKYKSGIWREVKNVANCYNGYCLVGFKDKIYYYHRIVWVLLMGDILDSSLEIDHIDSDSLNNNINNLRLVSNRQNQQNRFKQKLQQKIGYSFYKRDNKWKSYIRINKKLIYLGLFTNEEDAAQIYQIACENINQYVNNSQFRSLCKSLL